MDFTAVWCDTCNASFTTSYTAGDPGWVVDCHWPHYSHHDSYYIMPRWQEAALRLVCKNNADPWNMDTDYCDDDTCQPDPKLTTDQAPNLRAGLHQCQLGDIYGWSLNGYVPTIANYPYDLRTRAHLYRQGTDTPEAWSPYLAVSGLNQAERDLLQQVKRHLVARKRNEADHWLEQDQQYLQALYDQPHDIPLITYRTYLPPVDQLAERQKYLLYRWDLQKLHGERLYARPIWRIVTERLSENRYALHREYNIIAETICPDPK